MSISCRNKRIRTGIEGLSGDQVQEFMAVYVFRTHSSLPQISSQYSGGGTKTVRSVSLLPLSYNTGLSALYAVSLYICISRSV